MQPDGRCRHQPEHGARRPTGETKATASDQHHAEGATQQAREIEQAELHPTQRPFEQVAQLVEEQHVEADVDETEVQEPR